MKVIYTAKRGILDTINGGDNSMVKTMISDFYKNKINVNPIDTKEDGSKFNTVTHNGFEYSEAMLHEYCRAKTDEGGVPMSYWGNLLSMIGLAVNTGDGVCAIWDINLIIKADASILDEVTPVWLPNSKDDEANQLLWRNWRGVDSFYQNGDDVFLLTITDRKLSMVEILSLKQYSDDNPSLNMLFLSNTEYLEEKITWQ